MGTLVSLQALSRYGPMRLVTAEELDLFCRERKDFSDFKRPRRYEMVASLPKSPTGKLLRRGLRGLGDP